MTKQLAVLGYHKIGPPAPGGWESWYYVPEEIFVSHLETLRDGGWKILDVDALLRGLETPESLPDKSALITFDDGYKSILDYAAQHLEAFDFPGVIFVPTKFIGGMNAFDQGTEPDERICDWDELRELDHRGISVQSHTVSHPWLSQLEPPQIEEEFARSKSDLETSLRKIVELFAYPFGEIGKDPQFTKRTLRNFGYRAAFLYAGGLNQLPITDGFAIERLAIGPDTNLNEALSRGDAAVS